MTSNSEDRQATSNSSRTPTKPTRPSPPYRQPVLQHPLNPTSASSASPARRRPPRPSTSRSAPDRHHRGCGRTNRTPQLSRPPPSTSTSTPSRRSSSHAVESPCRRVAQLSLQPFDRGGGDSCSVRTSGEKLSGRTCKQTRTERADVSRRTFALERGSPLARTVSRTIWRQPVRAHRSPLRQLVHAGARQL